MADPDNAVDEMQQLADVHLRFYDFLYNYCEFRQPPAGADEEGGERDFVYREQVKSMANGERALQETVVINMNHVKWYDNDLAEQIEIEWLRLEPRLRQAVQRLVREVASDFVRGDDQNDREFFIAWEGFNNIERLRDLRSAKVGGLLAWKGTVTRTTEVRPELSLATYKCGLCGELVRNVQQQFVMTYPSICPAAACGNKKVWKLVKEESSFVDWQRAKVQENADEMPPGSLPRAMDAIIRNEMVESVRPGDKAVFVGSLIVIPDMAAFAVPGERTLLQAKGAPSSAPPGKGVSGIATVGARELHYKLAFLACNVLIHDQKQSMVDARTENNVCLEEVEHEMGEARLQRLRDMSSNSDIYNQLARSIAPNVYGHADVKKAVLLMLVGGVSKVTAEGIRLRGDINVAIVGDPSTAKSQILKFVAGFLPRAVFTGGKSSSAAGLTATVVKEADSREYAIEAGALMLADNGICCIDEFDKMDVKDQVAIHEAMEQQTISVAKAGIQATLNARAAILAAANPLGGRYDRSKPLKYNVNLPPAILSRFDLLHVMVDEVNPAVDEAIAYHILASHREEENKPPYTQTELQHYIRYARALKPKLTTAARTKLVEAFKALRSNDAVPGNSSVYRITVRQLEALIRLSEALARVHHRTQVLVADVREAQRLIKASVHSAGDGDVVMDLPADMEEQEELAQELLHEDDGPPAADAEMAAPPDAEDKQADAVERDENAQDENREGGRRVRRRPDEPVAFDGDEAPAEKPLAPQAEAAEAAPEQIRISRTKWTYLHNHVLACIKQAEDGHLESAQRIESSAQTFMGVSQHDILKWHVKQELEKNAIESKEQVVTEIQLMQKVIQVMLAREGTLIEMQVPDRRAGEGRQEYVTRREKERVLVINPNFYME